MALAMNCGIGFVRESVNELIDIYSEFSVFFVLLVLFLAFRLPIWLTRMTKVFFAVGTQHENRGGQSAELDQWRRITIGHAESE